MEQPPAVEQRFRAAGQLLGEAIERALVRNPSAARLLAVTEDVCRWLKVSPVRTPSAVRAVRFIGRNLSIAADYLESDADVSYYAAVGSESIHRILMQWAMWLIFGDSVLASTQYGITYSRLLEGQRVEFSRDPEGRPSLNASTAPGVERERKMLLPVARWQAEHEGFANERPGKEKRAGVEPAELESERLRGAFDAVYRDDPSLPQRRVAAKFGLSRSAFDERFKPKRYSQLKAEYLIARGQSKAAPNRT